MLCEVNCIMGSSKTMDYLGIDSVDLSSRVKLGGSNGNIPGRRYGNMGLFYVKSMNVGSGKSTVSVGINSRRIDTKEGEITVINSGELAKIQGGPRGVKMTCLVAVTTQEINFPYSDREGDRRGVSFEIGRSSEENITIEVLGSSKERRSETMGSGFKVGDLVWGKVKSHPWWPGHIFDESLSSSEVMQMKTEGFLLVAFFGDDTYGWLHPTDLLPFERHYKKNSKQSTSKDFLMAVQDAVEELNRRAELGLACCCRTPSNFRSENSVDQVERSLEEFRPPEMVIFLQKLALGPTNMPVDGEYLKNVAKILAYRKAVFEEKDYTYAEAFGVLPKSHGDSNDRGKAVYQGAENTKKEPRSPAPKSPNKVACSSKYVTDVACSETSVLGKRVKNRNSVDAQKRLCTDNVSKASGDRVSKNRSTPAAVKPAMPISHQRNNKETMVLDKIPLITKPSKSLGSVVPLEKAPRKNVKDLPSENRDEIKASTSPKAAEEDMVEPRTMLLIKFPRQARLPSTSELKAKFVRFGPLDVSATYASWRTPTCHVCFMRSSDASAAYEHFLGNGNMYGSTKVSCYLQDLDISSPKSPESAKLLSRAVKNVPQRWSSSTGEGDSGSDRRGSYLLSTEADSREDYTVKIQQTILPSALPPLVPAYPAIFSPEALSQFAETMNKKHLERSQSANPSSSHGQQTTASNKADIYIPMLKLLNSLAKSIDHVKERWTYSLPKA